MNLVRRFFNKERCFIEFRRRGKDRLESVLVPTERLGDYPARVRDCIEAIIWETEPDLFQKAVRAFCANKGFLESEYDE